MLYTLQKRFGNTFYIIFLTLAAVAAAILLRTGIFLVIKDKQLENHSSLGLILTIIFPLIITPLVAQIGIKVLGRQLREKEKTITKQRDFLQSVIESLDSPFYVINVDDYTIELANKAAQSKGIHTTETCDTLTHNRDAPCDGLKHSRSLPTVKKSKHPTVTEHIHFDQAGNPINVEVHAYPILNEDGEVARMIEYAIDITERKRAEAALHEYMTELETKNAELDDFAHTIAHDLRNPLTVILTYATVLADSKIKFTAEKQQEYLHTIARRSKKMAQIIDDLLLLSRVRHKEPVQFHVLPMKTVVSSAIERLSSLIEEHNAKLDFSEMLEWSPVVGYAPWVEEVWVNYISNALKYGGSPPRVKLGSRVQSDGFVRFWVEDNGFGLLSTDSEALFLPFERLHKESVEGHGLGLSIVKRIVTQLGGEVGVEQSKGSGIGTVFYFTLPSAPIRTANGNEKLGSSDWKLKGQNSPIPSPSFVEKPVFAMHEA